MSNESVRVARQTKVGIAVVASFVAVLAGAAAAVFKLGCTETLSRADLNLRSAVDPPGRPVSTSYSALGKPRLRCTEPLCVCTPPTGHDVFGIRATAQEFLNYQRDPQVSFVIDESGFVQSVTLLRSSGSPEIDAKAIKMVTVAKYTPSEECVSSWSVKTAVTVDF